MICVSYTAALKMESTRIASGDFISLELHEKINAFKSVRWNALCQLNCSNLENGIN